MRGLVPHDRVCEMRSGAVLWRRARPVGAAHSVLSGRSSRRCAGALSSPSCWWLRLLHGRECPAVSGELAGDGDHDDRAGLASGLERVPAIVQPAGCALGLGLDGEGLALPSAFERDAPERRSATSPSRRVSALRPGGRPSSSQRSAFPRTTWQPSSRTVAMTSCGCGPPAARSPRQTISSTPRRAAREARGGRARALEDGLEQRRTLRLVAGDDRVLKAPVPDDRPRNIASERNLPLPPVHVRRRGGMLADRDEKGRFEWTVRSWRTRFVPAAAWPLTV
jgi:hypothetical protein